MRAPTCTARNAACLVYKAIQPALSPVNDPQYRELLDLYRADPSFASMVDEVADGLELSVLDFSERGLVVVPTSRESKFAMRITDLRANLKPGQKAGLVLAHVAVAAAFYPTTSGLEDDSFVPPPASLAQFRDTLLALARRLKDGAEEADDEDTPDELASGWELICAMPLMMPGAQRASPASVTGLISIALLNMEAGGLVRVAREADDETQVTYTPTHRLQVQLRELTLRRLFEIAQMGTTAMQA
ncbi:hypothetical protein DBR44_13160 [Aquitalea sp. FJL05]|uniref:hypothetical protein n=1 Tax=Aquitalea sp. FJL05 TaxID=2153366 RepID=UPI000F5B191B|nr:hypothetical protein [Aquitalea sp. FJL05]RQO69205.1 hypothetical protein DBR44_13160 [Aquitalea sp. FJL05]